MTQKDASPSTSGVVSTKDKIVFFVKIAVSLGLLGLCLYLIDVEKSFQMLISIDPLLLVLAFLCTALGTIVFPAIITHKALIISKIPLTLRQLVVLNLAIRFYGTILPRAFSVWLRWKRYGQGKLTGNALALLVFERIAQLATLSVFAFIALTIEYQSLGVVGKQLWWFAAFMSGFTILIIAPFLSHNAANILQWGLPLANNYLPKFISSRVHNLLDAVIAFRAMDYRVIAGIIGYSIAAYVLFVTSAYICAIALDIPIDFLALMWIRPMVFMLTLVPISVAGIGLREIGFASLLALYGIDLNTAIAFSFANFSLQLILALIGGSLEAKNTFLQTKLKNLEPV